MFHSDYREIKLKEDEYEYLIIKTKEKYTTLIKEEKSEEYVKVAEFKRPEFDLEDVKQDIYYLHDNHVNTYRKETKHETQNTN